jgi:hypothetical protein
MGLLVGRRGRRLRIGDGEDFGLQINSGARESGRRRTTKRNIQGVRGVRGGAAGRVDGIGPIAPILGQAGGFKCALLDQRKAVAGALKRFDKTRRLLLAIFPVQSKQPQAAAGRIVVSEGAIVSQRAFKFEGARSKEVCGWQDGFVEAIRDGGDVILAGGHG